MRWLFCHFCFLSTFEAFSTAALSLKDTDMVNSLFCVSRLHSLVPPVYMSMIFIIGTGYRRLTISRYWIKLIFDYLETGLPFA
ncbi:hypothetical protein O9993_05770 [Vibrio lentus]|nr:hypothetical protein [Vibrio lentus]